MEREWETVAADRSEMLARVTSKMSKYREALEAILNVNHSTFTDQNKLFRIFEIAKEALKRGAL